MVHPHAFGGHWTDDKLAILKGYLAAYTRILSKQPFETHYIDAFAGSGTRRHANSTASSAAEEFLFAVEDRDDVGLLLDGSAKIALETEPPFSRHVFIDLDPAKCEHLRELTAAYPTRRAEVRESDANVALQGLAREDWTRRRGVVFIDPYGMQVTWQTLEAVARTKALDVWILFPLGVGVQRLLQRDGNIPAGWERRLTSVFGTPTWRQEFFTSAIQPSLWGDQDEVVLKTATADSIAEFFKRRLRTVFPTVSPEHVLLRNKTNCPLFMLCFAAGNAGQGGKIALRVAGHLLSGWRKT